LHGGRIWRTGGPGPDPGPGQAKFKKKEIEVSGGQQTELTKPKEPVKEQQKQTGPTLTVEAFVGQQRDKINKITNKQIKYMLRLDHAIPTDDDPQKPDYYVPPRRAPCREAAELHLDARALDQKVFEAQQAKNSGLAASLKQKQQKFEKDAEKIGAGGGQELRLGLQVPEVQPHGRGALSASPTSCR
jgi:hypothetical protein